MTVYPPGTWTLREVERTLERFARDKSEVDAALTALLRDGHVMIHTRYGITIIENGEVHYGEQLFELRTVARAPALMADATDES